MRRRRSRRRSRLPCPGEGTAAHWRAGQPDEIREGVRIAGGLGAATHDDFGRGFVAIDALDIDTPSEEVVGAMAMSGFSRVPVCEGDIDHIVGFVYIKDVFLQQYLGRPVDLRRLVKEPDRVLRPFKLDRCNVNVKSAIPCPCQLKSNVGRNI